MELNGQIIRMIRNARRITIMELAAHAELSIGHLSDIENGNVRLTANAHAKIEKVFDQVGVTPEEIDCIKKLLEVTR